MTWSISYVRCCKYLLGLTFASVMLTFFLLSQFTLTASKIRLVHGSLIQRNLNKLPGSFGRDINHWLSKNILRQRWENIHCRRQTNNESLALNEVISRWVRKLSRELNIKDGQSLIDTNTGCLEWIRHFRVEFPYLKIAVYDEDEDAIDYARRTFNDSPSSYVKKLSRIKNSTYDFALNIGGLQTKRADKQCSKVKAILRTLKPGGSLYLGHNLERNCRTLACKRCFSDMENVGFVVLDTCFWSNICLKDETDVVDVYYISEQALFGSGQYFGACQTGVFIRKKTDSFQSTEARDGPRVFQSSKVSSMYRCQ